MDSNFEFEKILKSLSKQDLTEVINRINAIKGIGGIANIEYPNLLSHGFLEEIPNTFMYKITPKATKFINWMQDKNV